MAKRTPTPWTVDHYGTVNAPNGRVVMINGVASVCSPGDAQDEAKANARFIAHAVNCHDQLVEALIEVRRVGDDKMAFRSEWIAAVAKADAALAAAQPKEINP